jgi:hypothetical protein
MLILNECATTPSHPGRPAQTDMAVAVPGGIDEAVKLVRRIGGGTRSQ